MRKLLLVMGLLALALAAYVQAQPGGGRMGQGMAARGGRAFSLESDWAVICFDLQVDDETLAKLRPLFKRAWDERKELMEDVRSGNVDRMMLMEEMVAIQEELEKEYGGMLSEEQLQKLTELKAARAGAWQRGGQRRGMQGGQRGRP